MPPLRRTALHPPLRYTIARRQASGGHTPTAEILPTHKGPHGNFHNSIIQSFGGCNSVRLESSRHPSPQTASSGSFRQACKILAFFRGRGRSAVAYNHYLKAGKTVESMSGPDRAMLYIVAGWTGFRRGEVGTRLWRWDVAPPAFRTGLTTCRPAARGTLGTATANRGWTISSFTTAVKTIPSTASGTRPKRRSCPRSAVDDFRYLHTLEVLVEQSLQAGSRPQRAAASRAREFLDALRDSVEANPYVGRPRNMNEYATTFIPQPEIAPADYDRIREAAAQFIEILQAEP